MDALRLYLRTSWPFALAGAAGIAFGAWLGGAAGYPWTLTLPWALACGAVLVFALALVMAAWETLRP
jgi:hypothetical protein